MVSCAMSLKKLLHLSGIHRRINLFLANYIFTGTRPFACRVKRELLQGIGWSVGEGTIIVGPIECFGTLVVGRDCWIGKNLRINGNGTVIIGDRCDIAPEVTFQTGGHEIGTAERRAGKGQIFTQMVGNGVWIGGRSTIIGNTEIGDGCVVAGCACVIHDVPPNTLVGGVPAKIIRKLDV